MNRPTMVSSLLFAVVLLSAPATCRAGAPADSFPGYRSPGTAILLSTVATVVPLAIGIATAAHDDARGNDSAAPALLILGGYFLGPAVGHVYAGRPGRAAAGIGMRTLGTFAVSAAIAASWNGENTGADAVGLVGAGTSTFFLVYDIVRAGHSATVTNTKLAARASVRPAVISSAPGVRVSVAL